MGNREEKLRQRIVDMYGSIPKFSEVSGIPKSTVYNIFDRGIENTRTKTMDSVYEYIASDDEPDDGTMGGDEAELMEMFGKMSAEQRAAIMDVARAMLG